MFSKDPTLEKKLGPFGFIPKPLLFLAFHFCWFFVCHLVSIISCWSFVFNTVFAISTMQWSCFQGACYYMDYFSKRYAKQLEKLSQLEEIVLETPTVRKSPSQTAKTLDSPKPDPAPVKEAP